MSIININLKGNRAMKKLKPIQRSTIPATKFDPVVYDYLIKLRIPPHFEGYRIVYHTLSSHVEEIPFCKFTALYTQLGKELNTTSSRVERALRHMIEKSWDQIEPCQLKSSLSIKSSSRNYPTVAHYLSAIAYDFMIYRDTLKTNLDNKGE